jgi:crotonobetainyl-CoA:carnitine CoA-transferase CaiB-like acyl-CoA transferase
MPAEKFKGPLSGVRILDLSQGAAGPYGSMILGDLGAEIIKIESHEGDLDRRMAGPNHKGEPYYHLAANRNKKSIILNLRTRTGKEAFYDLVKVSDVVWDNFRAGATERLGIDFDTLKKINPRIICCSLSGFGTSGPLRDRPAFDIIGLAVSGILSITGEPGRTPVRPGPPLGDQAEGIFGVIGAISALYHRERTGKGQKVDVSMLDSCLSLMIFNLVHYLCSGKVLGREGSRHLSVVPYGVFNTKKGFLALAPSWPRIARVVGADWMIDDPRFETTELRLKNRDLLEGTIQEHLLQAEAKDWMALMEVEDVPAAMINDESQVVTEPQVLHNKMILSLKHPLGGEVKTVGNPVKMPGLIDEEAYEETYTAAPTLGQHQEEVLRDILGYSQEKIAQLVEEEKEHREELSVSLHKKY